MKTLDEFDAEKWAEYEAMEKMRKPHPNGIQCPKCGNELWDSNPCLVLTSYPPKKDVHCPSCDYRGYRLA